MPGSKHDWIDFEQYLSIHDRCLDRAYTYFVEHSDLVAPDILLRKKYGFMAASSARAVL